MFKQNVYIIFSVNILTRLTHYATYEESF